MRAAIEASLAGGRPGLVQFSEKSYATDPGLSPRLEEMRGLLRLGMTNKSIAQQLKLSAGTVKNYMSELFKQLNVTNRTQAARFSEALK
jgi:DNA-binding NarL/FixJ family response regulator